MNVERVRDFLAGKNRSVEYMMASAFGAITPFCSYSSILFFLVLPQLVSLLDPVALMVACRQ
jgi:uncharacterized membrane protein YraQ (UPF0718 family)